MRRSASGMSVLVERVLLQRRAAWTFSLDLETVSGKDTRSSQLRRLLPTDAPRPLVVGAYSYGENLQASSSAEMDLHPAARRARRTARTGDRAMGRTVDRGPVHVGGPTGGPPSPIGRTRVPSTGPTARSVRPLPRHPVVPACGARRLRLLPRGVVRPRDGIAALRPPRTGLQPDEVSARHPPHRGALLRDHVQSRSFDAGHLGGRPGTARGYAVPGTGRRRGEEGARVPPVRSVPRRRALDQTGERPSLPSGDDPPAAGSAPAGRRGRPGSHSLGRAPSLLILLAERLLRGWAPPPRAHRDRRPSSGVTRSA